MKVKSIQDLHIGQHYEKKYVFTEEQGRKFAQISQDYNPIHLEEEVAVKSRFGQKIVHGMLIGSYFSGIIGNDFPGAGSIYISQKIFFRHPVYYNTNIKIRVEVIDIDREKKRVLLKTQCVDINNVLLVDGEAKILFEN